MEIEYLGHSCFKLTDSTGVSVVCDPYSDGVGFKMPNIEADAVTISHHHFDHDCADNVLNTPVVIDKEGSYDVHGVKINSINSFHDPFRGKKRGKNLIFKFLTDGITVCHLGDLGEPCSNELIEKIQSVNVLLIPVGGNYTIDAKTAKDYVEKLNPQIVIPMHFRTDDCKIDIAGVDEFLKLFDKDNICEKKNCLKLLKTDLGEKPTKIIVLRRVG